MPQSTTLEPFTNSYPLCQHGFTLTTWVACVSKGSMCKQSWHLISSTSYKTINKSFATDFTTSIK